MVQRKREFALLVRENRKFRQVLNDDGPLQYIMGRVMSDKHCFERVRCLRKSGKVKMEQHTARLIVRCGGKVLT